MLINASAKITRHRRVNFHTEGRTTAARRAYFCYARLFVWLISICTVLELTSRSDHSLGVPSGFRIGYSVTAIEQFASATIRTIAAGRVCRYAQVSQQ